MVGADGRAGGRERLVYLLTRYGEAIEADLALGTATTSGGWDLAELWQSRRWRFLLNLIDHLPRGSRYVAALANDDELADEFGDEIENAPPPPPPLTEWTADHEKLTLIADRLGELLHLTAAANSDRKPPPYRMLPRPDTALKRKARRRRDHKRALIADRLAAARRAGRPTMAQVRADATQLVVAPRRRRPSGAVRG